MFAFVQARLIHSMRNTSSLPPMPPTWAFAITKLPTAKKDLLCRSSIRGHSEIMFGVLVIVLGRYPIARQEFCLGQG
jgi:hypothetical protein